MKQLPKELAALGEYRQFIPCRFDWRPEKNKFDKIPVDLNGRDCSAHDPAHWVDATTACTIATLWGERYGVGFVFTVGDPFFFLDIDDCAEGGQWTPTAQQLLSAFAGAYVEVSKSGTGLHIIGSGEPMTPTERRRKKCPSGEFDIYTEGRFVALTGNQATGDAGHNCKTVLDNVIAQYGFIKSEDEITDETEWTDEPAPEWDGPADDAELIEKMLAARTSANAAFGGGVTVSQLWHADAEALGRAFPDDQGHKGREYDASKADAALAQYLAFWAGKNCERIRQLMWQSGLARDKWEVRPEYLERTIKGAVARCARVLGEGQNDGTPLDCPLKLAGTDDQKGYAARVVTDKLADATPEQREQVEAGRGFLKNAGYWIDRKDEPLQSIIDNARPVESATSTLRTEPEIVEGYQFLGVEQQIEFFRGCVYVLELNKIFTPSGDFLGKEQFNAAYGGYTFQMEADYSGKTTRRAWEAFTESQAVRFPRAESTAFRPYLPPGAIAEEEGRSLVNFYVPAKVRREKGDVTPFLEHLRKVIPNEREQLILLCFMAALVQYPGVKFQWAPFLQGVQGNGKTLFTRCIIKALGRRWCHIPRADEIAERFNDWTFINLFCGIEDTFIPGHRAEVQEILKPTITNELLPKRSMQQSQVMAWNCCNFILNSNHKDGVIKVQDDRRFCPIYTAQQTKADLERDGMDERYFERLYGWLKGEGEWAACGDDYGYACIAEYLATYEIMDELNPATQCTRAPDTGSTAEAIALSMGPIEQEIKEAAEEGRPGFAGGWISSMALDRLLNNMRATRTVPPNKRRDLLRSLGYDWHPALPGGRVHSPTVTDSGKPRLFIRDGHIHTNLRTVAEVIKAYDAAQSSIAAEKAATVFNGGG